MPRVALPESLRVMTCAAKIARTLRFVMLSRLYVEDTLLERLPQDLQHMPAKLRQLIQEEHAIVRQRHLARPRHLAPADQPAIGDGVMRGATRADRHQCGAVACE